MNTERAAKRHEKYFKTTIAITANNVTSPYIVQLCCTIERCCKKRNFGAHRNVECTQQFNDAQFALQWLIYQNYPMMSTAEHFHLGCLL